MSLKREQRELYYISFLQFIGPILVILGHSTNGLEVEGLWYVFSKKWIYIFHMPLFFFISGYLLNYNNWYCRDGYKSFLHRKFIRLLVPYLVWNFVFLFPKYIFQNFISDSISFNNEFLLMVFFKPRQMILGHTWYLFAAFLVYLLSPIWKKAFALKSSRILLLVIGIALYIIPINTEILCLNDLHKDLLFFWLGCYIANIDFKQFTSYCTRFFYANIVIAIITSILAIQLDYQIIKCISCMFILISLISIPLKYKVHNKRIIALSKNSFALYIMHWPVMLFTRIILNQVVKVPTWVTVIAMIVLGYLIPTIVVIILRKMKPCRIKEVLRVIVGV